MMVDSILDDAIGASSLSSRTWTASQLQEIQQLMPCLEDTTQDEYTRWFLTASQKKLQRESRIQRQALSNQHSNINAATTTTQAADDLTMKGQCSDDNDDSGDSDDEGDSNGFDMDTTKQGTTKAQDDKPAQLRKNSLQLDLKAALQSYGKHCDMNETTKDRKNQTRRRHTSLPATAPTRLPTSKTSTIHHRHSHLDLRYRQATSPSHVSSASKTMHISEMDGVFLPRHKQQQAAADTWLDFDPYGTHIIPIEPRQQRQPNRRPISMISSSFGTRSSCGTCATDQFQGKTDQQLVDLEAYLSQSPLKCTRKANDRSSYSCQATAKSPKTISNQHTINTRIPLPISKRIGSVNNKTISLDHQHHPLSLEPTPVNKSLTSKPWKQESGIMDGSESRRRPSLMSSDALKNQQKQLQQHLDINLVSVQGELCVPDGISQRGQMHRQQQQQQQQHHHHDLPLSSTALPRSRPFPRRVSSLHERLQELANDDSAWDEITKPIVETDTPGHRSKRNGAPISSSQQHTAGTSSTKKPQQTLPDKPSSQKHHGPPSPTSAPRPAMSPPTAYKLYKLLLSPFEQQEILKHQQIYFVGNHAKDKYRATMDRRHSNYGYDDARGDYMMVPHDHLAYRYEMLEIMGRGSFGQVIKAIDWKTGSLVAVKIIRNRKRFHAQALVEVKTLEDLLKWDPDDKHNNVRMTDHFYFRNHLCIAFECLDINLYDFIKGNNFQGFSLGLIRRFTIQLLNSLVLLHQHHLIHCDLKPENVLLKDPTKSTIKVIDFGSSCLENEKVYTYIQSRFYRAPEVMLGLDYGVEIDMWSVGCILAELYTGCPLFPGENEHDQLACIMEIQGVPSLSIVEKCTRRKLFFDSYGNPKIAINSKGKKRRPDTKSLADVLKGSDNKFVDFIDRCLQWNPSDRIKSEEAFKHSWIARQQQ